MMRAPLAAFLVFIAVSACKTDGGSDACPSRPACSGADDRSTYKTEGYESVTCAWYCKEGRYVSKTYELQGVCWRKADTFTSDGICPEA